MLNNSQIICSFFCTKIILSFSRKNYGIDLLDDNDNTFCGEEGGRGGRGVGVGLGSLGGGSWGEWEGEDGAEAKSQSLPATSSAERLQPRPLSTFNDIF